jgi:alkyl sulfatase BDS1-like metallo-beta-lactamase superfamily hydrolase
MSFPDSFDDTEPALGPDGQRAHPEAIAQLGRLAPRMYTVGPHAWCVVGNGLSNQTFIEGPDGLIAIDTGDSVEEMAGALAQLRTVTDRQIVACIYSHFHYVDGTAAILADSGWEEGELPVWGHERIAANRRRFGGEVAGRSRRGLVHQFGVLLPDEGPDALLHVGLGRFFSNPDHRPSTPGHLPVTQAFSNEVEAEIAGLRVVMRHAPSDADDSATIWFPDLGVCVNNLVWPALFNVFAIRGEEYRDPRVLIDGLDHVASLGPDFLIGAHGAPIEGAERIADEVRNYRDSIQFLWDQTVRGANDGLTADELAESIQLPGVYGASSLTRQHYGVAEHHVRQIHNGLFGWFDEDPSHLFPLPRSERATRLIAGFGGVEEVARQCRQAADDGDLRWAVELAGWLVVTEPDVEEFRRLLATPLRTIAQHTTAQNVRNWCLTRALSLEGSIDLSRFQGLRIRPSEVLHAPPATYVDVMRVLLVPDRAEGVDRHLAIRVDDVTRGLHVRRHVAVPTDGVGADLFMQLTHEAWAGLIGGKANLTDLLADGSVHTDDQAGLLAFLSMFDHPSFN